MAAGFRDGPRRCARVARAHAGGLPRLFRRCRLEDDQHARGGGYTASFTEGIARLVSLCLRSGVPVDEIIDQLEGIRSPRIAVDHGERVYSIPDAIAKAIKRHIGMQKTGVQPPVETFDENGGTGETDVELEKETRDAAGLLWKGLNPGGPRWGQYPCL